MFLALSLVPPSLSSSVHFAFFAFQYDIDNIRFVSEEVPYPFFMIGRIFQCFQDSSQCSCKQPSAKQPFAHIKSVILSNVQFVLQVFLFVLLLLCYQFWVLKFRCLFYLSWRWIGQAFLSPSDIFVNQKPNWSILKICSYIEIQWGCVYDVYFSFSNTLIPIINLTSLSLVMALQEFTCTFLLICSDSFCLLSFYY